jgi:DNA-binding ferritin-like protein
MGAQQAYWNVTEPGFVPRHAITDEVASAARRWADRVAGRAVDCVAPFVQRED